MLFLFRGVPWVVVHQCHTLVKGAGCGSEHRAVRLVDRHHECLGSLQALSAFQIGQYLMRKLRYARLRHA